MSDFYMSPNDMADHVEAASLKNSEDWEANAYIAKFLRQVPERMAERYRAGYESASRGEGW